MTLFRLDSSIFSEGSVSRDVADTVEAAWREQHPEGTVTRRDLGAEPLPARTLIDAATGGYAPPEQRTEGQTAAIALATSLADELVEAEAYLFAAPLYNFGVPAHVKAWIDAVITDPRFGPGSTSPITGRPAVLVVARGGGYAPGTPREGWDHSTAYLQRILGDVFKLDVQLVEAELTLAPKVPAMESLIPLFEQNLANAHSSARDIGKTLGQAAA